MQFHVKALRHMLRTKKLQPRSTAVNNNLITAWIEVGRMKAAAPNCESMISLSSFCHAEVGEIGHGRLDSQTMGSFIIEQKYKLCRILETVFILLQ